MKIFILEDEYVAKERIKKMLSEINPLAELTFSDSVESALEILATGYIPDLAFFDIQLGDGLSFEILESIPCNFPIVFTTAFDEYAIKAFKFNSVDYLLKPMSKEDLEISIKKYQKFYNASANKNSSEFTNSVPIQQILDMLPIKRKFKERFLIKSGDKYTPILTSEIAYFRMIDKAVYAYKSIGNIRYLLDYNLDELEKFINPDQFFRINRQYIASVNSIKKFSNLINGKLKIELEPHPQEEVTMSREKTQTFKDWMEQ